MTPISAAALARDCCSCRSCDLFWSIQAAAFPDTSQGYFFFVAACPNGVRDGSHRFAVTLAEHEANIAQAQAECP